MVNTCAIIGIFTSRHKWLRFSAVFALFVLMQLPFLHADADINLSRSRAPWTDEGLYTAQVRNGSIAGHISMDESDALVKEPGFAALAWIATQIGGDSMVVTRFVLIVVNGLLIAWLVSDAMIGMAVMVVVLPALFFAYYPFHYAHLAMAEMPAILMLFLALLFLSLRLSGQGSMNIVWAAFCIFLAYAIKVQFIYMVGLAQRGDCRCCLVSGPAVGGGSKGFCGCICYRSCILPTLWGRLAVTKLGIDFFHHAAASR